MVTNVAVGDESVDITGGKVPIEVYITSIFMDRPGSKNVKIKNPMHLNWISHTLLGCWMVHSCIYGKDPLSMLPLIVISTGSGAASLLRKCRERDLT